MLNPGNGEEVRSGGNSGDAGAVRELSRLGGQPAQFRMLTVSLLAAGIGLLAGVVAFFLYKLIGFFTNLFFFHRIGWD